MRFSLFFEMQISNPTAKTEQQLFHDCVDQAVLADQVGFDGIWAVEHHGLYEYSHSSAPEIFLAYVAAKTKNITLGHGCTLLPKSFNHPIRLAERLATLDILSNGRLAWGTAKSGTHVEQGAFELDPKELHAMWLESIEMVPKMWKDEAFSWKGNYYNIPPTHIVPKPTKQPPIFTACSRPELAIAAGELGLGALNFAIYKDEQLKEKIDAYRAAIARAVPIAGEVTNHFCCNPASLILKDDKKALEYGIRGSKFFTRSMANYYWTDRRHVGPVKAPRDFPNPKEVEAFAKYRNTSGSQLSAIFGDPTSAKETIQRFVDVGCDEIVFVLQTGTVPHELIMESIKTIGEDVIPHFK
jgi:alkanesulfonate monooxygenase SsuD/methylene tetrahydromethanopterin reductase-like flavin-dependent oxidoreductase (luciferase family)